jgi:hypothetical protein
MATLAPVVIAIWGRYNDTEFHIGDLTLEIKVVDGKVTLPTAEDVKSAFRNVVS